MVSGGITHTTATHRVIDSLAGVATVALEPWDTLICTSNAVRKSVRSSAGGRPERPLQPTRRDPFLQPAPGHHPPWGRWRTTSKPIRQTVWLGALSSAFPRTPLSPCSWVAPARPPKMNPALMAMALQHAAKQTGKDIHCDLRRSWSISDEVTAAHHKNTQRFLPEHSLSCGGRAPLADIACTASGPLRTFSFPFSENIQETFGLMPVEARWLQACPALSADWDGYRDTVRHRLDGFRISTYAPRARSLGATCAFAFASDWLNYRQGYIAAASQMTAVDMRAASEALVALILGAGADAKNRSTQARNKLERFSIGRRSFRNTKPSGRDGRHATGRALASPRRLTRTIRAALTLSVSSPATPPPHPAPRAQVACGSSGTWTWPLAEDILARPLAALAAWTMPFPEERRQMFD